MFGEDLLFPPFEGGGSLVIGLDKIINRLPQLSGGSEAGSFEGAATQDAEPDLNLVEPTGVSGGVVKMDVFVAAQPGVAFRLVGVEVVDDDVKLPSGISGHQFIHED